MKTFGVIAAVLVAIKAMPIHVDLAALDARAICPKDLPGAGEFEFPHLVIPISKSNPDTTYPNTYFPNVTPNDVATVFNFDVQGSGQVCELGFYFPRQGQLDTSSFTLSGPGTFTFSISVLGTGAQESVATWNNQPAAAQNGVPKTLTMQPGKYYSLRLGPCNPGLVALTMGSVDTCFTWFQDYNPCAIGPFITYNGTVQG